MYNFKLIFFIIMFLLSATTFVAAGYLPLLQAGMGVGAIPSPGGAIVQTDGTSFILLAGGGGHLIKVQ
jgi:hypothetical protein